MQQRHVYYKHTHTYIKEKHTTHTHTRVLYLIYTYKIQNNKQITIHTNVHSLEKSIKRDLEFERILLFGDYDIKKRKTKKTK